VCSVAQGGVVVVGLWAGCLVVWFLGSGAARDEVYTLHVGGSVRCV